MTHKSAKKLSGEEYDYAGMIESMRKVFEYLRALRCEIPVAENIQNPKTPSILSENLVCFLIRSREIDLQTEFVDLRLDRKAIADIVGVDIHQQEIKIEVKATGSNNFQRFSKNDVQADYLIWVDFGWLFEDRTSTVIDVYILRPKLDNLQATSVSLSRLRKHLHLDILPKQTIDLQRYNFC